MTTILTTRRLLLREMTRDDLDFVAELLGDPEVMRFYPAPYSRAQALTWIDDHLRRYRQDGRGLWLALEEDGTPVGQVGLALREVEGHLEPEIGYLIQRPYWRRGYASEAALGVRDHAFEELDLPRVISLIRQENTPSQGVARKLGMSEERRVDYKGLAHIVFGVRRTEATGS